MASPNAVGSELRKNLQCKKPWQEVSGSLGDLGTFVPIVVALALVNGIDLGTTLIATGIYNVITGFMFGVPMPVQPMKSIAAVAITEKNPLTVDQIMAAGICVSAATFVLGATGLIRLVAWIVPLPVVRGIQLAQGLSFAMKAVKYVMKKQNFAKDKATGDRPWLGLDGLLLALAALAFIVLATGSGEGIHTESPDEDNQKKPDIESGTGVGGQMEMQKVSPNPNLSHQNVENHEDHHPVSSSPINKFAHRIPSALIIFAIGIILAFVRSPSIIKHLRFGPSTPRIATISARDWRTGFVRAAIPQLPLTILNSVVAVCKLSKDLFPTKKRVTPTSVSVSVGMMNLVGCWFGALPMCHGAGGLAGQFRFGATTGMSVTILGTLKLLLGLLLGSSLIRILAAFPVGLLGILLLFSGVELGMTCRDQTTRLEAFVMLFCVAVSLGSNMAIGCVCAMLLYGLLKLRELDFRRVFSKSPRAQETSRV